MDKTLIASDSPVYPDFINVLRDSLRTSVETIFIDSTGNLGINKIMRHISYFVVAAKAFIRRKKYKYILFHQQFIGIYYSLICSILSFGDHVPIGIAVPFIYAERNGILGVFYRLVVRSVLVSNYIHGFVVHSMSERDMYLKKFGFKFNNKILFVKYGRNIYYTPSNSVDVDNQYFFSGGTTNRDYVTLIDAFRQIDEKLIIACFESDISNITIPSNVQIVHNVFGERFFDYMNGSLAVIVPIRNPQISSGQLVVLAAMALGKPIMATGGACLEDYLDANCAIILKERDTGSIINAVKNLKGNLKEKKKLASAAYHLYINELTLEKYAERISDLMKGCCNICRDV